MGHPSHDANKMPPDQGEEEVDPSSPSGPSNAPAQSQPEQNPTPGSEAPLRSQHRSSSMTVQQPGTVRNHPTQQHPQTQYGAPQPSGAPNPYAMSILASALPEHAGSPSGQQFQPQYQQNNPRPLAGASTPAVVYQLQPNLQFPHHGNPTYASPGAYSPYVQQFHGAYGQSPGPQPGVYAPFIATQQQQGAIQHPGSPFQHGSVQYYYYQDPYRRQSGTPPQFVPPGSQFAGPYHQRGDPQVSSTTQLPEGSATQPFAEAPSHNIPAGAVVAQLGERSSASRSSQDQQSGTTTVLRGPPRKPRQSGHALWVGNLPPGATVWDLKDHFSRDAKKDIESLFLISKSNCAFVNYRSEAACTAAMQRFHDSRFQGVRLVCRLRRSSAQASGIPTGPSSMATRRGSEPSPQKSTILDELEEAEAAEEEEDEDEQQVEISSEATRTSPIRKSERYFIVKSLTLQDLDQSVRNGIWATQAHNEESLNKAYQSADNVYLIFSANKSGEYFGYARMASPISENAEAIFGIVARSEINEPSDAPKSIPTPETEYAPRGRVIDDSARGTIFWEAEHSDYEEEIEQASEAVDGSEAEAGIQTWGKPFKVEWMSTTRLPFYRTRGLRNPWNANREVKIARDGTELEPGVGECLVQLFHRTGQPHPATPAAPGPSHTPSTDAETG